MKRRNADFGKPRRILKKNKIAESLYASTTFIYVKFLLVWALVLLADFILEFRFEYLWPFWLLLRSVYDSFKYQGLAFSVFFVFIALTSDMICFLFIPVHWLFFAASTYVWVQYVWHTEKGICLPTVSLWLLFVYIEASVRLKDIKSLPFHLDLCRPFAAHCIGYPVVTSGFGFKSYISYKMRLRKQKVVAKENEFYIELLQKALPQETVSSSLTTTALPATSSNSLSSLSVATTFVASSSLAAITATTTATSASITTSTNGEATIISNGHFASNHNHHLTKRVTVTEKTQNGNMINNTSINNHNNNNNHKNNNNNNSPKLNTEYDAKKLLHNGIEKHEMQYMEHPSKELIMKKFTSVNDFDEDIDNGECNNHKTSFKNLPMSLSNKSNQNASNTTTTMSSSSSTTSSPSATSITNSNSTKWNQSNHVNSNCLINSINGPVNSTASTASSRKTKNMLPNNLTTQKDDHVLKLEADIKRLKADLQASRQTEMELRGQLTSSLSNERGLRAEISQLQQDNENLQTKLHNLVTARQQDKQNLTQLEKKLIEEKKMKVNLEAQLLAEKKAKKAEEAAARAVALATAARTECTDNCKTKRRELENDLKQLKRELKLREEHLKQIDREAQSLRQYKDSHGDTEILMSALSAMQDKTAHLENSLSAETRLKLDLFSALGDTKRQLAITQTLLAQKDKEIDELKSKIADVMSVLPQTPTSSAYSSIENNLVSSILYSTRFLKEQSQMNQMDHQGKSGLDPNASVYTPKCDL